MSCARRLVLNEFFNSRIAAPETVAQVGVLGLRVVRCFDDVGWLHGFRRILYIARYSSNGCGFGRGIVRPLQGELHVLQATSTRTLGCQSMSRMVISGRGAQSPAKPCWTPAFSTVRRCLSTAALPPFRFTLGEFHGGQNRLAVVVWFPLTVSLPSQTLRDVGPMRALGVTQPRKSPHLDGGEQNTGF